MKCKNCNKELRNDEILDFGEYCLDCFQNLFVGIEEEKDARTRKDN